MKNSDLRFFTELISLAAIWGLSFLFMRIASPEFGPLALISVRTGVAALTLVPFVLYSREVFIILRHWPMFLWLGATTIAIPFTLISYTTLSLTAGNTSLLNATVPMFSAIIAWYWLKESLSARSILGLLVGFVGVFVLSSLESGNYQKNILAVAASLLATGLYAYGSCYAKLKLQHFRSITVAAGGQIFAALFMLPLGFIFWPDKAPSSLSIISSLLLGVFCTALALIIYFHLLKKAGVAKTVSVTYLIPVFGILWGVIFLQEALTLRMLAGGAW